MKKLLISTSVATALVLGGCGGGETIQDLRADNPVKPPSSRIKFDPGAGDLNIPNDLLMIPDDGAIVDYTLNIPVKNASDFSDPLVAVNSLDGWSTTQPMLLEVNMAPGATIDNSTLSAGISLVKTTFTSSELPEGVSATCFAGALIPGSCSVTETLQFNVDYTLKLVSGNTVAIIPLRPLDSFTGYMIVVTDDLKDSNGYEIKGSSTWELVKQDITTLPLASDSQLKLQTIVNGYINTLASEGFTREELTYVGAFNTQSIMDVTDTIKKMVVANYARRVVEDDDNAKDSLPAIVASDPNQGVPTNAMEALQLVSAEIVNNAIQSAGQVAGLTTSQIAAITNVVDFRALQTCTGLLNAAEGNETISTSGITDSEMLYILGTANALASGISPQILASGVGPFCAAKHITGTVALPYYLATPTEINPSAPLTESMTAACDNGLALSLAPIEVISQLTPGNNDDMCKALNLRDLGLDSERNLTTFSPVPAMKGRLGGFENLNVQITIPNVDTVAKLDEEGEGLVRPEAGWPVVILSHGITSTKEAMLAITGILSMQGYATVAIDQPLHNSRGFDTDNDGVDDINASTNSATDYMNLAHLKVARDNLRQSVADLLGLRIALHKIVDTTTGSVVDLNPNEVSLMGVSLGAMTGGNFAGIANSSMGGSLAGLDYMFSIQTAALESPGGGVANFLLESKEFSPLIKSLLTASSSDEFEKFLIENQVNPEDQAALIIAYDNFYTALSDEAKEAINSVFNEFVFAAGTVLDSGDPMNYANLIGSNTPVVGFTVVGDGSSENPSDTVIPAITSNQLFGQIPYWRAMGATQVSSSQTGDDLKGYVLFNQGGHGSSLNPNLSEAVTKEIQTQIATFLLTSGMSIPVNETGIIVN
jgi:Pla-1/cef family extracellular lipase